jgi:hypothetical protein
MGCAPARSSRRSRGTWRRSSVTSSSSPSGSRSWAETAAIEHYNRIIEQTDEVDPVTHDMVIDILRDEQRHRRLFEGYLREYVGDGTA